MHVFFPQELGTSGNLDGQQRLIVKGRFLPKGFENVIRRYMNEYVLCASCKSPDTLLDRDAGDYLLPLCNKRQSATPCMHCRLQIESQVTLATVSWRIQVSCSLQARVSCFCGASSVAHRGQWQPSR